ncbi:MAG TPA: G1 family glutamic endopeptidase [Candidatus Limnocylindria bacterium]|nr:G1 family glutamic endopeptidase [Candidatus Limnocylindria bacterium]
MTAEAPRLPAPAKRRSPTALVAVLLALVLLALGALDVSRLAGGLPLPTQQRTSAQTEVTQRDAVKQTIQRSNEAQAGAFNSGDPSVMKRYATDSFYQELLKTNQDLAASGVTRIEIVSTEWGDIAVDGASARATTFETWRSTFRDGSSDESTARNDYALVSQDGAWKIDADDQPGAVLRPAPRTQTDTGAPAAATRSSTSSNWSGYAARGGSFTSVTGTWTVPTVTATTSGADATWVGIGGVDSRDLIQAGTQATVSGGEVSYDAWIEMLPASSRPVSLSVAPGDSVTVTIAQKSGADWTITIKNNTTGGRYSTTVQYRSTNSSAEWIEEAPSIGRGTVALDSFGAVRFTGASAVRDGKTLDLGALGAEAITMINGSRQAIATPSVIGSDGSSFTVTRTDAPATAPGTGNPRRRRG